MKEYFWNDGVYLHLGRAIPSEPTCTWADNVKYVTLRSSECFTYVDVVEPNGETIRIFIEPKEMKKLLKTLKKCLKSLEKDGGKRFLRRLRRTDND